MAQRLIHLSETRDWDRFFRSHFFNSLGGFKSANLIGTNHSRSGVNLALFFSVIHVGAKPPLLGLLFRPPSEDHQSYVNIKENGFFSVNAVHQDIVAQAHQCSATYPADSSEFEATGLEEEWLEDYPVPLVKESKIKCVAQWKEEHMVAANGTIFMVGEIQAALVEEEYLPPTGFIDHASAKTVAINSLEHYYKTEHLAHFPYARPKKDS